MQRLIRRREFAARQIYPQLFRLLTFARSVFDDKGHAHAAADAECGQAAVRVALEHLVQKRDDDARAGAADGVAERDGSAVDVELAAIEVEFAIAGEHLRGKGLVEFDEIEVREFEGVFLFELAEAGTGPMPMMRGSTPAELAARMRAIGLRLFCVANFSLARTTAAAPSVIPEEFAA